MPIAQKQPLTIEETYIVEYGDSEEIVPSIPTLDLAIIKEINDAQEKTKKLQDEERDYRRKIEKLTNVVLAATEILKKAEDKRQQLLNRKDALQKVLDTKKQKRLEALNYWNNYGLEIKQISTDEDKFKHYDFIFTDPSKRQTQNKYIIGVKFHDGKLEIISQSPNEIFSADIVDKLNKLLNDRCVGSGEVDYKLVMLTIKRELIKSPILNQSDSKICQRLPA